MECQGDGLQLRTQRRHLCVAATVCVCDASALARMRRWCGALWWRRDLHRKEAVEERVVVLEDERAVRPLGAVGEHAAVLGEHLLGRREPAKALDAALRNHVVDDAMHAPAVEEHVANLERVEAVRAGETDLSRDFGRVEARSGGGVSDERVHGARLRRLHRLVIKEAAEGQ